MTRDAIEWLEQRPLIFPPHTDLTVRPMLELVQDHEAARCGSWIVGPGIGFNECLVCGDNPIVVGD